jgi:uncharacterized membrane protein
MIDWAHAGPSVLAAFLASLVEFVEALTIVLAVGTVRGWYPALIGTAGGVVLLAALVIVLGPALSLIPITVLQLVVGTLLLLFGMRWLRKAMLRAAGAIPLHDEAEAFAKEAATLRRGGLAAAVKWDTVAVVTSFKAVVLEGLEVVFIVIAIGATGNMLVPASIGAALAGIIVVALGLALHRPLAQVPENTLKFTVGVILSAFGVFWVAKGLGYEWPGDDLSVIGLVLILLAVSVAAVPTLRRHAGLARPVAMKQQEARSP